MRPLPKFLSRHFVQHITQKLLGPNGRVWVDIDPAEHTRTYTIGIDLKPGRHIAGVGKSLKDAVLEAFGREPEAPKP